MKRTLLGIFLLLTFALQATAVELPVYHCLMSDFSRGRISHTSSVEIRPQQVVAVALDDQAHSLTFHAFGNTLIVDVSETQTHQQMANMQVVGQIATLHLREPNVTISCRHAN